MSHDNISPQQIANHLGKAGDEALTIPRIQAVVAGFLLVEAATKAAKAADAKAAKADAAKAAAGAAKIEFKTMLEAMELLPPP